MKIVPFYHSYFYHLPCLNISKVNLIPIIIKGERIPFYYDASVLTVPCNRMPEIQFNKHPLNKLNVSYLNLSRFKLLSFILKGEKNNLHYSASVLNIPCNKMTVVKCTMQWFKKLDVILENRSQKIQIYRLFGFDK